MVNTVTMKKLLTLVVLVAGVALFAGCMNKPTTTEDTTVPTDEVTTTTTDEVMPAEEAITEEATTDEVVPEATAE